MVITNLTYFGFVANKHFLFLHYEVAWIKSVNFYNTVDTQYLQASLGSTYRMKTDTSKQLLALYFICTVSFWNKSFSKQSSRKFGSHAM